MAGEGAAGHEAGSPPGESGGCNGSDAAVSGAASPRRRGKSRTDGASGGRRGGSVRAALDNGHPIVSSRLETTGVSTGTT